MRGEGPEDLREICLALAGMMLSLGKEGLSYKEGRSLAEETLDSGAAYGKFLDMVEGQGGDLSYIENMDKFQRAACERELTAGEEGYISSMDTEGIGITAGILGAGRETKESVIDHSAGIVMKKKIGDWVRRGDAIAVLYSSSEEKLDRAERCMQRCYTISDRRPEPLKLVVDIIR